MKRNHKLFLVALLALLSLPLVLPSPATADTLSQKRARAREIMKQLSVLDVRMEKAVERYDAATGQLDTVKARIKTNERTLALTRYNLQLARDQLKQRVVSMYKQRPVELLDVVLATNSFSALVDQLQMINRVGRSDAGMVSSIDDYRVDIIKTQKALQTDRVAALKLVAERSVEKSQVEQQLSQRRAMLRGVKSEIAHLEEQQAAAARQAAQQSGGFVLTAQPVNPDTSSIVAFAESFVGKSPYLWGGSTPAGFDCSGFTMYCWQHFGVSLPHNAAAQQATCQPVSNPQPGDLVFFGSPAYHVGIYIGGGSMVHAPHTGTYVSYGSVAGAAGFGRP